MKEQKNNKGFILLMAVLVSSIILAIGLGIFSLSLKELVLASYLKESAVAFGAADRAMECALYWDRSTPTQNGMQYTIFTTSTAYQTPWDLDPTTYDESDVLCDSTNLTNASVTSWDAVNIPDPNTGTTNFELKFNDNNTCATVMVYKEGNTFTTIISSGYSTCNPSDPRRTERTIQVEGSF